MKADHGARKKKGNVQSLFLSPSPTPRMLGSPPKPRIQWERTIPPMCCLCNTDKPRPFQDTTEKSRLCPLLTFLDLKQKLKWPPDHPFTSCVFSVQSGLMNLLVWWDCFGVTWESSRGHDLTQQLPYSERVSLVSVSWKAFLCKKYLWNRDEFSVT